MGNATLAEQQTEEFVRVTYTARFRRHVSVVYTLYFICLIDLMFCVLK
jgi:hypothetical protein